MRPDLVYLWRVMTHSVLAACSLSFQNAMSRCTQATSTPRIHTCPPGRGWPRGPLHAVCRSRPSRRPLTSDPGRRCQSMLQHNTYRVTSSNSPRHSVTRVKSRMSHDLTVTAIDNNVTQYAAIDQANHTRAVEAVTAPSPCRGYPVIRHCNRQSYPWVNTPTVLCTHPIQ